MSKYITLGESTDWEVELPRSGRKDRVKDISHKKKSGRKLMPSGGSDYDCCYNGLSYNYNGKEVTLDKLTEADCGGKMEYISVGK